MPKLVLSIADKYPLTSLPQDQNGVFVEAVQVVYDLATTGGTFQELTFGITIIYGQLNIMIHDDGGETPYCAINAMTIQTA